VGDPRKVRLVEEVTLSAGKTFTVDIPKDNLIRRLAVLLNLTLDTTDLAAGDIRDNAPCDFIPRIEVNAGGSDTRISMRMAALMAQGQIDNQGAIVQSAVATSATLLTCEALIPIPLGMERRAPQFDGENFFDPRNLSSLTLSMEIAAAAAQGTIFFVAGEPTAVGSSLSATAKVILDGITPEARPADARNIAFRQSEMVLPVTATSDRLRLNIENGQALRGVLIMAYDGAEAVSYRSNAVLNYVSLMSGSVRFFDRVPARALQAFAGVRNGQNGLPTGTYYIDASEIGRWGDYYKTALMDRLTLEFDVTAGTNSKLIVCPQYAGEIV